MDWNSIFEYRNGNIHWRVRPSKRVKVGDVAGSKTSHGYVMVNFQANGERKPRYVHRIVWEMHYGPVPEMLDIDHINRNRSDNRIENLRLATRSQNLMNNAGCGVTFDKRRAHQKKPWIAQVRIGNGKKFYKTCETKDEALAIVAQVKLVRD